MKDADFYLEVYSSVDVERIGQNSGPTSASEPHLPCDQSKQLKSKVRVEIQLGKQQQGHSQLPLCAWSQEQL